MTFRKVGRLTGGASARGLRQVQDIAPVGWALQQRRSNQRRYLTFATLPPVPSSPIRA